MKKILFTIAIFYQLNSTILHYNSSNFYVGVGNASGLINNILTNQVSIKIGSMSGVVGSELVVTKNDYFATNKDISNLYNYAIEGNMVFRVSGDSLRPQFKIGYNVLLGAIIEIGIYKPLDRRSQLSLEAGYKGGYKNYFTNMLIGSINFKF